VRRLLVLLLFALPLFGQSRESITVEVIDVPVYVSRNGQPVTGLTRDDFEVTVNGKPQPIDYFDVDDLGLSAPAAAQPGAPQPEAAPPPIRERRLFLLVIDRQFSNPHAVGRARAAAEKLVNSAAPADWFSVTTFDGGGTRLLVPFTQDRVAVMRAVRSLRPSTTEDPLRLSISPLERQSWSGVDRDEAAPGADLTDVDPLSSRPESGTAVMADMGADPMRRSIGYQVQALRELARSTAQIEGHKHVVLLSEGFATMLAARSDKLVRAIRVMAEEFRAASAFLHTVDLGGLRGPAAPIGQMGQSNRSLTNTSANDALNMLAQPTGGQWLHNTNDVATALTQMAESQRIVYRLGFRPRNPRRGMNAIVVRVKNVRGADVMYRHGFSTTHEDAPVNPLRLADIILNDLPQTGVAPRLEPLPDGIRIVVPAAAAAQDAKARDAELLLYLFDANGVPADVHSLRVPFNGSDRIVDVHRSWPPGRYVAKALLRVGDAIGFARTELVRE
jgi:VWFA-related protein